VLTKFYFDKLYIKYFSLSRRILTFAFNEVSQMHVFILCFTMQTAYIFYHFDKADSTIAVVSRVS